jgi:hypothetical protein
MRTQAFIPYNAGNVYKRKNELEVLQEWEKYKGDKSKHEWFLGVVRQIYFDGHITYRFLQKMEKEIKQHLNIKKIII